MYIQTGPGGGPLPLHYSDSPSPQVWGFGDWGQGLSISKEIVVSIHKFCMRKSFKSQILKARRIQTPFIRLRDS